MSINLERKLAKSKLERWLIRLETSHPDGNTFDGVVLAFTKDLIVLRAERDFEFDGIQVLARKFVTGFRDGRVERCHNQILERERESRRIELPRWMGSLETIAQVVATLKNRDIWPIVEIIFDNGNDSAFYLGPLLKIRDTEFTLRCYDGAGKWEKGYEIANDEVLRIEFGDKYSNTFNAYMRSMSK